MTPDAGAPGTPRVLVSGVDTLEVFTRGAVTFEWTERLKEWKHWAEDGGGSVSIDVGAHPFRLSAARTRRAPFLLESAAMAVSVNPWAVGSFPAASAEVRSAFLWQLGPAEAAERVRRLLQTFGGYASDPLRVTRVDLAVDFQGRPFTYEDGPGFVTRAGRTTPHVVMEAHRRRQVLTGFSFGGGGPVMCRIYNKSEEIRTQSPDKAWFHDVWARSPHFDPSEDVWRCEFQLRRKGLASFKRDGSPLDTWEDVAANARRLWAALTSKWLRRPGQRTNRNRQTMAEDWRELHDGGFSEPMWGGGGSADLTRRGRSEVLKRDDTQLAGYLARAVAAHLVEHPAATVAAAVAASVSRAELVLAARGTDLRGRAEERIAAHLDALRAIQDRQPPLPPDPAPAAPAEPKPYDLTNPQLTIPIQWIYA